MKDIVMNETQESLVLDALDYVDVIGNMLTERGAFNPAFKRVSSTVVDELSVLLGNIKMTQTQRHDTSHAIKSLSQSLNEPLKQGVATFDLGNDALVNLPITSKDLLNMIHRSLLNILNTQGDN